MQQDKLHGSRLKCNCSNVGRKRKKKTITTPETTESAAGEGLADFHFTPLMAHGKSDLSLHRVGCRTLSKGTRGLVRTEHAGRDVIGGSLARTNRAGA